MRHAVTVPADAVQSVGEGPDLLLIHGTGADRASWNILVRLLRDRARITSYDRRGAPAWPLAENAAPPSVEEHAADAADLIARHTASGSAFVCGVSFGATVALELMHQRPDLVRGAALFEPRLAARDDIVGHRHPLLPEIEALVREGKGEQAAELFQRRLLSDAFWQRLPEARKARMRSAWRQIHGDLVANAAYRPRYDELAERDIPVLLLQGGKSPSVFEGALSAAATALRRSRRRTLPSAGHRLVGRAWHELAEALLELMG